MSTATVSKPTVKRGKIPAIGPAQNGICMSPEEFDAITEYDRDYRYELIRGVLIVNAIPARAERGPNEHLGQMLLNFKERHPKGSSLDDTLTEEYVRTATGRRRADRVIWAGLGRQPTATDHATIAVEFVSEGRRNWTRDYVVKRDEYYEVGIEEYWIINRFDRTLTVFRRTAKGWKQILVHEGEIYRTPLLPGFELDVARLFATADRWRTQ